MIQQPDTDPTDALPSVGVIVGRLIRAGNPPIFLLDVGRAGRTNPDVEEVMSSCSEDPTQDLNRR